MRIGIATDKQESVLTSEIQTVVHGLQKRGHVVHVTSPHCTNARMNMDNHIPLHGLTLPTQDKKSLSIVPKAQAMRFLAQIDVLHMRGVGPLSHQILPLAHTQNITTVLHVDSLDEIDEHTSQYAHVIAYTTPSTSQHQSSRVTLQIPSLKVPHALKPSRAAFRSAHNLRTTEYILVALPQHEQSLRELCAFLGENRINTPCIFLLPDTLLSIARQLAVKHRIAQTAVLLSRTPAWQRSAAIIAADALLCSDCHVKNDAFNQLPSFCLHCHKNPLAALEYFQSINQKNQTVQSNVTNKHYIDVIIGMYTLARRLASTS